MFHTIFNVVFFAVFFYYAWDLFSKAQAPTIILRAPRQVPYASILIGGFLILVYCIRDLIAAVRELIHGGK